MKKRLLLLLVATSLLLSLVGCGTQERYDLLHTVELDGLTYNVRGSGFRAKQITVKKGEELLWITSVKVNKDVGSQRGNYGLMIDDLNFDGKRDVALATDVSGDCLVYDCWLWDEESASYQKNKKLSGLGNVKADADMKAIFSFTQSQTITKAPSPNLPDITTTIDSATKHIWVDGVLTPEMRLSSIYYSETNRYCYRVEYYEEEAKDFEIDQEKWFTPEEYKAVDWGFLYYYK